MIFLLRPLVLKMQGHFKNTETLKTEQKKADGKFKTYEDLIESRPGGFTKPANIIRADKIVEHCKQKDPDATGEWICKHEQTEELMFKEVEYTSQRATEQRDSMGTKQDSGMEPVISPERPGRKRTGRMTPHKADPAPKKGAKAKKGAKKAVDVTMEAFKTCKDQVSHLDSMRRKARKMTQQMKEGGDWSWAVDEQIEAKKMTQTLEKALCSDFTSAVLDSKGSKDLLKVLQQAMLPLPKV